MDNNVPLISITIMVLGHFLWSAYIFIVWKTRMDAKVDLIWKQLIEPLLKRALADGLLRRKSPLQLNYEALRDHMELLDQVQNFYSKNGKNLTDWELMRDLEVIFGERFSAVAESTGFSWDGLMLAAVFLVRPSMSVFTEWNEKHWKKVDDRGANKGRAGGDEDANG